ncbi:MAG: hypothetical protein PHC62_10360 [Candidatus Izemoplasmatales bacterium]|nr:hypothetical protein [Candidatus Izemoplasmatales bacterium]
MLNDFIESQICPVCLGKANYIGFSDTKNPNLIEIDCKICNPEEFGRFFIGRGVEEKLVLLNENQRKSMSERIRNNISQKADRVIITSDNFEEYSQENKWNL